MTGKKQRLCFIGIGMNQFVTMLIMCGVGVYGYEAAVQYGYTENFSVLITLETAARCISIPFSGVLSEYMGRKKLYCFSVLAYIGFYAAGILADHFWVFVIMRMFTGAAWGLFITNALVLMTSIFPLDKAPKYSGYLQTISTVAMAVGGPVAGLICGVNWRLEFYIFLPVMMFGLILAFVILPQDEKVIIRSNKKEPKMRKSVIARWRGLFQKRHFVYMLLLTFLYNIANATGNYLTAYAQSELHVSVFMSSLITTPGIIIAIIVTSWVGVMVARTRKYKKVTVVWVVFAGLGFGSWWICNPIQTGKYGSYCILMIGYMIAGVATAISQIAPYTYPMHYLEEKNVSEGVSLIGWSGTFGAVIANSICSAISHTACGLEGILKMAVVPSVLMIYLMMRYRDS